MSPNAFPRRAVVLCCACALAAVAAPAAHAQPLHQVVAGESLSQIAAVNGLSPAALAAANGVPVDAPIRVGQVVSIPARAGASAPPVTDVVATPASAGSSSGAGTGTSTATTSSTGTAAAGSSTGTGAGPAGASSAGGVVVRPGDTLSAIAARAGVSVSALAAHNGLTASALLPAGRRLSLPAAGAATSSSEARGTASATQEQAPGATGVAPSSGVRVSGSQVGSAAAANGVPTALARAIAWQESGNDNGAVSSVGARGVMQVMPDTWTWIDRNLSSRTLDPSSATDNVQAGTLYLQHLLQETGGDQDQAAAAYYQGLSSVRRRGMYDDTKRYVESVRALRARFGG